GKRSIAEVDVLRDRSRSVAREADVGAIEGQEAEVERGPTVEPKMGREVEDILEIDRGSARAVLLERQFRGEPGIHASGVEPERVGNVAGELRPGLGGGEEQSGGGDRT